MHYTDILERIAHNLHLILKTWMTYVDDMEQKIGLKHFIKR